MAQCTGYVTVKQVGKPSIEIPIDDQMTVMDVKGEILMELDVPTPLQRILLKGKVLPDDQLLIDLGIRDGTVVNLIAKKPKASAKKDSRKSDFDFAASLASVESTSGTTAPDPRAPQPDSKVRLEKVSAKLASITSQANGSVAMLKEFAASDGMGNITTALHNSSASIREAASGLCSAVRG